MKIDTNTLHTTMPSPIGTLVIGTDGEHVTELRMEGARYFDAIPATWQKSNGHPVLDETAQQLDEYFAGRRVDFNLPMLMHGTVFQQSVWQALLTVPFGVITSYAEISRRVGNPKAIRAVGSAIGRNPICIIVPCHRILGSNGSLTGFAGGLDHKRKLLEIERVELTRTVGDTLF